MKKILVIGAGPIIVGQACEFDYSGTQACKTLKEEKYKVILLNSNPATIMTDVEIADSIYLEKINKKNLIKIILKEKPNFILPTMGGQTGLNCILELINSNFIHNSKILGINKKTLINAENRRIFFKFIKNIGLKCPDSIVLNKNDCINFEKIQFPCIIRSSFTLGGLGSGIAYSKKEFLNLIKNSFSFSKEIIIDKSILGWKEYELELLIDVYSNVIVICCIENIDPVGIHTGDSITITPAQTLSDKEYQNLRDCSFIILKSIGLRGAGANVQFAINPTNGDVVIIEMNPRVSRSSALASKATGYPIAKISTKISIGYNILKLLNDITYKNLPASFEPSIDYVVIKFPKFNFEKFKNFNFLNTMMKSVGEIMSIGSSFKDSFLKSIFSLLEIKKIPSFIKNKRYNDYKFFIINKIINPNSKRIFYILDSFRLNFNIKFIFCLSKIDCWFLFNIKNIIDYEKKFFNKNTFFKIFYKQIDSCSNEFVCPTSYLYSSKNNFNDFRNIFNKKILIIGSGCNKIGQSIEFDYCCTKASKFIKKLGFCSILINCNPETVSTDYDISSILIFDPLIYNFINNLIYFLKPNFVICQFGGQTPLNFLKKKKKINKNIFTLSKKINSICNSKNKFKKVLSTLNLNLFNNYYSKNLNDLIFYFSILIKPLILRPSYIIGGSQINIVKNNNNFINYINKNKKFIFIEEFLINSKEIDVDVLIEKGRILNYFIIEHVEYAGIHSGDSMAVFPTFTYNKKIKKKINYIISIICYKLKLNGIINFQICYKKKIYIIECNPRSSRTIPFISKSSKFPFVYNYISLLLGYNIIFKEKINNFFFLKESIFPLNKFNIGKLCPEMRSTGEIIGIGLSIQECFLKTQEINNNFLHTNLKNIFLFLKYFKKKINISCNSFYKKIFFDLHIFSKTSKKKKNKNLISIILKKIYNKNTYTTIPMIRIFLSSFLKKDIIIRKINNI